MDAVIICGPTGSGKSAVGMEIARRYKGSIISADSRQIYRRLDIGTAKPSKEDRAEIPHYMIDVADVNEDFTAARFAAEAINNIELIIALNRIPILVGGTGLYIEALTEGIFIGPGKDEKIRRELKKTADAAGLHVLYERLADVDPDTAEFISPNDEVRIIRALEIFEQTGIPPGRIRQTGDYLKSDLEFLWIGVAPPRSILYRRIDTRVEKMVEDGLINEVKKLVEDGLSDHIKRKKIVGYYEIIDALNTSDDLANAIRLVKQHSRNYAKRQLTWFRNRTSPTWLNSDDSLFYDKVFALLDENFNRA